MQTGISWGGILCNPSPSRKNCNANEAEDHRNGYNQVGWRDIVGLDDYPDVSLMR